MSRKSAAVGTGAIAFNPPVDMAVADVGVDRASRQIVGHQISESFSRFFTCPQIFNFNFN